MKTKNTSKRTTNLILTFLFLLISFNNTHAQIITLTEGFEAKSGTELPVGWGSNYYVDLSLNAAGTETVNPYSGSRNAFLFPKTSAPAETGYLVTPLVAAGVWTFSFWVKQTSGDSETYTVGICDDQTGLNFTTVNVSPASFSGSTTYTFYSFTLTFNTNKYIAISTGVNNINTLAIDDINLTGTPLPIELVEFNVLKNNHYADLNWVTATETNNYGFDIEKSTDLKTWNKISFVAGAGNSNQLKEYNYNDLLNENIDNNNVIVYYRLKQIDYDGAYKYTGVKSLNISSVNQDVPVIFNLYPNPATKYVNINSNQPNQQFEVQIFNQKGNLIKNNSMVGNLQINISDLTPATYQVIITDKSNAKQYQYKFIKIQN